MKKLLLFVWLFSVLVAVSAPAPPILRQALSTNTVTGSFTNNQVPTWDASGLTWIPGNGGSSTGGITLAQATNITDQALLAALTNANTMHVMKNGNDTTAVVGQQGKPSLTLTNGAARAKAHGTNGVILVWPGVFDVASNQFEVPWGWKARALGGRGSVIITGQAAFSGIGPIVQGTSNNVISGFTIVASQNGWIQSCIGARNVNMENVTFEECDLIGEDDCGFWQSTASSNVWLVNVRTRGGYDSIHWQSTGHELNIRNSYLFSQYSTNSNQASSGSARGVHAAIGTVNLFNTSVIALDGTNRTHAISAVATSGKVRLKSGTSIFASSALGDVKWILNSNGVVEVDAGVAIDLAKVYSKTNTDLVLPSSLVASNAFFNGLPGTGDCVAAHPDGYLWKTNCGSAGSSSVSTNLDNLTVTNLTTLLGNLNVLGTASLGPIQHQQDSGTATAFDMTVSAGASAGSEQSLALKVDSVTYLKFGGNQTGGTVTNPAVTLPAGSGLIVGPSGATLTNFLSALAALDFPDTAAGTHSDLPITVTGVTTNHFVSVSAPFQGMMPNSSYGAFTSNDTVWVRFVNGSLVSSQNPAAAVYRYEAHGFR